MNKTTIAFIVVAIAVAIAVFLSSQKNSEGASESITGTLDNSVTEKQLDQQSAAVAASLISSSPEGADVFFLEPGNGSTVTSPVTVKFGITNMTVAPAGQDIENSGHHHLLINIDELPPLDQPLPATDQLIHFGGGQTETTIELEPGEHTLQLVLGNYLHIPHGEPVISKKINITVASADE